MGPTSWALRLGCPCTHRYLTRAILSYKEAQPYTIVLVSAGSCRQVWGLPLFTETLPTGKNTEVLGDQVTALSDPRVTIHGKVTCFLFHMTHEHP